MRILVTNDDSINSKGLIALVNIAKKYFAPEEIVVIAPKIEQSAKSHSINVSTGFALEKYDLKMEIASYACDSSPADCVRSAKWALKKEFDLVLSGINNGFNLGEDIAYSGTVAAATEAALQGKIGIALSSEVDDYESVVSNFDKIYEYLKTNKLLEIGKLYNINVPKNPKGIMITRQGNTNFNTWFEKIDSEYYQRGYHQYFLDNNKTSDTWAICNHYISFTPLSFDRTDNDLFKKIAKLS